MRRTEENFKFLISIRGEAQRPLASLKHGPATALQKGGLKKQKEIFDMKNTITETLERERGRGERG